MPEWLLKDYYGMKRCRFCQAWEQTITQIVGQMTEIWGPCKDCFKQPDPNAWCGYFRSGGLLPEAAIDVQVANREDGPILHQRLERLAWFDEHSDMKRRWPETYAGLRGNSRPQWTAINCAELAKTLDAQLQPVTVTFGIPERYLRNA